MLIYIGEQYMGSNFLQDLRWANSEEVTNWWHTVHKSVIKDVIQIVDVEDKQTQMLGIDRYIHTVNNIISVEEKTDRTQYENIAFEVESTKNKTKGWAYKEIHSTLFAYGFINQNKAYYFNTQDLLETFKLKYTQWAAMYKVRSVRGSKSLVLPVPINRVLDSVQYYKEYTKE